MYGTLSKACTNSIHDQHSLYPGGQHTLLFNYNCVKPVGQHTVVRVGNISALTLKGGVICRHSSADKLIIHLIVGRNDCITFADVKLQPQLLISEVTVIMPCHVV